MVLRIVLENVLKVVSENLFEIVLRIVPGNTLETQCYYICRIWHSVHMYMMKCPTGTRLPFGGFVRTL